MSPKGIERREHKRVVRPLCLKSASNGDLIEMSCRNISQGGAYCISDVDFSLTTKLKVHLYLPSADGRSVDSASPLMIDAYVVRSEKIARGPNKDRFRLAILFKELDKDQAAALTAYLKTTAQSRKSESESVPVR